MKTLKDFIPENAQYKFKDLIQKKVILKSY